METQQFNRQQIQDSFAECRQLKELVKVLEKKAQLQGQVICSIRLNGIMLSEQDEIRFAETNINEIENIELQLEETNKLVAETIINLRDNLVRLKARALSTADSVRENPAGKAQIEFSNLMDQMRYLTEALATLKFRLKMDLTSQTIWAKAEASSGKMIKELLEAFSQQDFILVGDILEYEMHNLLEQWVEVLDQSEFD